MLGRVVNNPANLLYPALKQGDTVDLEAYVVDLEQTVRQPGGGSALLRSG